MLTIWIDGAARSNPGPAAAAGVVQRGTEIVAEWGIPLGVKTNNEAEYLGLIAALQWLKSNPEPVTIYSDSRLIVEQVLGHWKIKASHLQQLNNEAKTLLRSLPAVKLVSIPREQNREADRLANLALDRNEVVGLGNYLPALDSITLSSK